MKLLLPRPGIRRAPSSFVSLLVATMTNQLAQGIIGFVLPLVAITLTSSPLLVSGLVLAQTVPWLAFGLLSGVVVDRLDRRLVLLAVTSVRLAVTMALCAALLLDGESIALLYLVALTMGITETLLEPALIAKIPEVTPVGRLDHANARIIGGRLVAENFAQPIAGILVTIGLALAVGSAGLGFAIATSALLLMQNATPPGRSPRLARSASSLRAEVAAGLRFLMATEPLRTITLTSAVINASWAAWWSVWVLYAVTPGPVGLSAFGLGLLMTVGGVSSLLGAALAIPFHQRVGKRWGIAANIVGNGLLFAISALTDNIILIGIAIVAGEFGGPGWGIVSNALQQHLVPDDLRGRVASAYRFIGFGAKAIGAVIGGSVATAISIPALYAICAIATLATLVPFWRHVTNAAMQIGTPATVSEKET